MAASTATTLCLATVGRARGYLAGELEAGHPVQESDYFRTNERRSSRSEDVSGYLASDDPGYPSTPTEPQPYHDPYRDQYRDPLVDPLTQPAHDPLSEPHDPLTDPLAGHGVGRATTPTTASTARRRRTRRPSQPPSAPGCRSPSPSRQHRLRPPSRTGTRDVARPAATTSRSASSVATTTRTRRRPRRTAAPRPPVAATRRCWRRTPASPTWASGRSGRVRHRRFRGCLAVLIALAVLGGGIGFAVLKGQSFLVGKLYHPRLQRCGERQGHHRGEVRPDVHPDRRHARVQGRGEERQGVQPGPVRPELTLDPARLVHLARRRARPPRWPATRPEVGVLDRVSIPQGLRPKAILASWTSRPSFRAGPRRRDKNPAGLGLPSWAKGKAEGFLFPATYDIDPGTTAETLLTQMVERLNRRGQRDRARHRQRRQDRGPVAVPGHDRRQHGPGRDEPPGGLRQGRAGHLQPAARHEAADGLDRPLRRRQSTAGSSPRPRSAQHDRRTTPTSTRACRRRRSTRRRRGRCGRGAQPGAGRLACTSSRSTWTPARPRSPARPTSTERT